MQYFICYNDERLIGPLSREEATKQLFELSGTFKGLYIIIVDEKTGRVKGEINRKRRR